MASQLVSDVMTSPVLTVAPSDPTDEVGKAMAREDIKSVVVTTEDCAVEGIFTATDYMELGIIAADSASTTVGDCMATDVVTVDLDESVITAAERMVDNDISHLPVVDADEKVTGMVTSTDLTACLTEREP